MSKDPLEAPNLEDLALRYQIADRDEKQAKKLKDELRPSLMIMMSEAAENARPLDVITTTLTAKELAAHDGDVRKWVAQNYPLYTLTNYTSTDGENYAITLEENPELRKYEFEAGDYKFGRTVRMEGAQFRTEEFYRWIDTAVKSGELGLDTAILLDECVDVDEVVTYSLDEETAVKMMSEHPETMPYFERFSYVGAPKVALLPISVVKPDE